MARLTTKARNNLRADQFAGPNRTYPDQNLSHARDAIRMVDKNGSPVLKAEVKAAVHRKYPGVKIGK